MLGLALERLRDVGHRALIVVVEVTRGRAGVPALRPVGLKRNRRVEDFERVGIVLDPDRLARPLKQEIGGVRAGFGIVVQKPGDDPGSLVRVLRGGEPRIEIGALFRGRFRRRLVLFRLRRPSGLAWGPARPGVASGAAGGSSAHADAPARKAAIARLAKRERAGCRIAQF